MPRFNVPQKEIDEAVERLMDAFDGDEDFYSYVRENRKYLIETFNIYDNYQDKDDVVSVWHDILEKLFKYGKWHTDNNIGGEVTRAFQYGSDPSYYFKLFRETAPSFLEWRVPMNDPLFKKRHKLVRIDESVNGEEK